MANDKNIQSLCPTPHLSMITGNRTFLLNPDPVYDFKIISK